jgi:starvation-inducible DNA-binding protein
MVEIKQPIQWRLAMAIKGSRRRSPQLEAQPILNQRGKEIQTFGTLVFYPIDLSEETRAASVEALNQVLVDTMYLRDLYKKHHWQVTGATFFQLHLLFDKHFKEQVELVDLIAERIQILGGLALGTPHDVAERTKIERAPREREQVPVQLSRLIEAHTVILKEARDAARIATANGDDSTNNLLVSFVLPENEKEVWFLSAHLADTPLVRAH